MADVSELFDQLRATLGKMEVVLDAVNDALAWTGETGKIQWCNRPFAELVGRRSLEVIGADLAELLPLSERGRTLPPEAHPVSQALKGASRAVGDYELARGGTSKTLEVYSTSARLGGQGASVILAIRDITRRKRAEDALRVSEERTRLMVESVRDYAIFMLDPQGRVATWSAGAERIKGYRAEEIVGRHFSLFYAPEEVAAGKPEMELAAAGREGRLEDEGWRVRKDGSVFWANVVISAIRGPGGELLGYSKVARDLTERKRAEEALLAAKKEAEAYSKELESFSYSVAHDLRGPLRSMDGFSEQLLAKYADKLDAEGRDSLERVRSGSVRMGLLIDGLLGLSRVTRTPMRRETVDLSVMARDILETARITSPERTAQVIIARDLRCEGDPGLLRVALENLLGNAWKYTGKKPKPTIEFGLKQAAGRATYFVRDDGAGFDMAFVAKLFKPFSRLHTRRDFEGSGVGLATVQRIIARHGGRIWAEGQVGRGAAFYFTLWEGENE